MHTTEDTNSDSTRPWETLEAIIEAGDSQRLEFFLSDLSSGEQARALSRLDDDDRRLVLTVLPPEEAAELVSHLSDAQASELIELLGPEEAAAIVHELPSNEQADLLGDLDDANAEAILAALEPSEAAAVRSLTEYDDEVAGGLMVTELLQFRQTMTIGDVVENLTANAEDYRSYDIQYGYIVDRRKRLVGVLRMRDLLLAARQLPVAEIMIQQPLSVADNTTLDALIDFFDVNHFLGVPVVDANGRLLGVVQRSAVDEARADRNESDYLKSQGIVGGEELRTMPIWRRTRRRLAWLSINIVLNIMAASIIAGFQDTLSAVIALAVFLPIISDMSGCSGNQAVAVSMRELALGLVRPQDLWRVLRQEAGVGIINGVVLGSIVAVLAFIWKGNVYLGLVVGVALCLNTMLAVLIGGSVPLVLKRFDFDPAVASGPLLTTITDMCGFFLVLGLASALISQLTGG
ncbi:magnesium transporter [Planctomycetaceae bacterium SH139]